MAVYKKFLILLLSVCFPLVFSSCSSSEKELSFPLDAQGRLNRDVILIDNVEYSVTPRKDSTGTDLDDSMTVRDSLDVKTDGETLTVVLPTVSPVTTWRTDTDTELIKLEQKGVNVGREPADGESLEVQIFTVKKPADGKPLLFKFVNIKDAEKPFDEVVAARELTINIK